MTARAIMVLGTTSGAGKSWLATALCRWYARQGLKVAPFKAQNMSNNARVVPAFDGAMGEIGSAQYFQALAARARPDVLGEPHHEAAHSLAVGARFDLARTKQGLVLAVCDMTWTGMATYFRMAK